jgi:hypothetical protein
MSTNESVYPRWEREGRVSRFFIGPSLAIYQIEETKLIGGIDVRRVRVGQSGFSWSIRIREKCQGSVCTRLRGQEKWPGGGDRRMGAKPASKTQVSAGMDLAVG